MGEDSDDECGSYEALESVGGMGASVNAWEEEIERWRTFDVSPFIGPDGLLNYYDLFTQVKELFPLHWAVFRRVAPCVTVEANVERLFSCSGRLSDPSMNASTLCK